MLASIEQAFLKLKQVVVDKQQLMQSINKRLIETRLAMESNISDFEILEYAQTPIYPQRSYRKLMAVGAWVMAFVATAICLALSAVFDPRLRTGFDVKQLSDVDVSGAIPNLSEVAPSTYYAQLNLFLAAVRSRFMASPGRSITVTGLDQCNGSIIQSNGYIREVCESLGNSLSDGGKVLTISIVPEGASSPIEAHPINRALMFGCELPKTINTKSDIDQFVLAENDAFFQHTFDSREITNFLEKCLAQYDLVIWKMCRPPEHLQFYKTVALNSAFNVITFRGGVVPKRRCKI